MEKAKRRFAPESWVGNGVPSPTLGFRFEGHDRFTLLVNSSAWFAPNEDDFTPNEDDIAPNKADFTSSKDGFTPSEDGFAPNKDDFAPSKDDFAPNEDSFTPNEDSFTPSEDDFAPSEDDFTLNSKMDFKPVGQNQKNSQERFIKSVTWTKNPIR